MIHSTDHAQKIWTKYIAEDNSLESEGSELDPYLKEVWDRCKRRQRYDHWPPLSYAKGVTLASLKRNKSYLIDVAIPVIEDICEFLEDSCSALLITDETGCTLGLCASEEMRELLRPYGIYEGVYWREATMGNNAITSAISLAQATKTVGHEHFKQPLHQFASYAAPIFNSQGNILGTVALIMPYELASPTSQGLVYSAAKEIASNMYAEHCLTESNQHLSEVYVLLEGVEEGVLAWDTQGVVHYLNKKGSTLLDLESNKALGNKVDSLIHLPQKVRHAIESKQELEMFETTVESNQKLISLLMSLRLVKDEQNHVHSYIVLMHPIEHIRQLVHHHSGNLAHLTFDDLVFNSDGMQKVLRLAKHAAKGRGSVLLRGEEGLGKADLAQAIHNASERRDKAFIAINCQAIPHVSMIAEFLGSDADSDNPFPSKFELANGGTLFLDHIEYLTSEVQAALLHLLKTGLVNRLDHTVVPVDIRIIATSGSDLTQYVDEKRFGRQLMYELQSFDIEIPPLRERAEDIPTLVTRYLKFLRGSTGTDISLSNDTMMQLQQYSWPGNNRELRSVLERALSFSDGETISKNDLPDSVLRDRSENADNIRQDLTLAQVEKQAILQAAKACQGKPGKMCALLDVNRTTLWRKLKNYQINLEDFH
ncbi:dihydroxyacetone kinase operon transcriptional regulator DhaR [Vibrio hannami]|uniref:dihydroxyacetone kinase operon transcriptional regulator DhaR n=1 Tax=Vibrio hannami TaxID=2717094 RepID=UPI00241005AB|nr:dihydroxyacetone kinase operon transcriptional regulator DhaR [Vibrio hannami]MDG3087849.1 dihydroxyacetone kinase operon transcriptional regulator DhaR [Vibrio hannami]